MASKDLLPERMRRVRSAGGCSSTPGKGPPEGGPGPPLGGPLGGPPGGSRGCTFSRVFNNSPSRDRCWLFREERVVSGGPNFGPRGPAGPVPGGPGPPRRGVPGPPSQGVQKGGILAPPETPQNGPFLTPPGTPRRGGPRPPGGGYLDTPWRYPRAYSRDPVLGVPPEAIQSPIVSSCGRLSTLGPDRSGPSSRVPVGWSRRL